MYLFQNLFKFLLKAFFEIYFRIAGQPNIDKFLRKTIELYEGNDFSSLFSKIRIWDSPFMEVEKAVPKQGLVVDLGCGDGILANYLAISGKNRKILGIEVNRNRLKNAYKGLKNTNFKYGSIIKIKFSRPDVFILSHVLHHLPNRNFQEVVLRNCFKNLKKGGRLIIIEIAEKPLLKYIFTWLTDAFTVPILFEHKMYDFNFYYRKTEEWIGLLKKIGFKVTSRLIHQSKPFSHVMFIATKG